MLECCLHARPNDKLHSVSILFTQRRYNETWCTIVNCSLSGTTQLLMKHTLYWLRDEKMKRTYNNTFSYSFNLIIILADCRIMFSNPKKDTFHSHIHLNSHTSLQFVLYSWYQCISPKLVLSNKSIEPHPRQMRFLCCGIASPLIDFNATDVKRGASLIGKMQTF